MILRFQRLLLARTIVPKDQIVELLVWYAHQILVPEGTEFRTPGVESLADVVLGSSKDGFPDAVVSKQASVVASVRSSNVMRAAATSRKYSASSQSLGGSFSFTKSISFGGEASPSISGGSRSLTGALASGSMGAMAAAVAAARKSAAKADRSSARRDDRQSIVAASGTSGGVSHTFSPPTYATMVSHLPRTSFHVHCAKHYLGRICPTYFRSVSPLSVRVTLV